MKDVPFNYMETRNILENQISIVPNYISKIIRMLWAALYMIYRFISINYMQGFRCLLPFAKSWQKCSIWRVSEKFDFCLIAVFSTVSFFVYVSTADTIICIIEQLMFLIMFNRTVLFTLIYWWFKIENKISNLMN